MRRNRNWAALVAAIGLVASSGCGEGSPPSVSSSSEKVNVKGTVTLNGKPLTSGLVMFDAANINRRDAPAAKLEIGKDGSYSGSTLIGENAVTVSGPAIGTGQLSMNRKEVVLKAGDNVLDVSLP